MSTAVEPQAHKLHPEIVARGLTPYVLQLEVDGLTIVPPEVHGVPLATFDAMTQEVLALCQALVGCAFTLEGGPSEDLEFPDSAADILNTLSAKPVALEDLSQFVIQKLGERHRLFRDLAVNPAAVALARHLIGQNDTRFSSFNAFVKWQGDFGYGETLGMHVDQTTVPLPWGARPFTVNTNWLLTDYTKEAGALAYVPGSHRFGSRPVQPQAAKAAIPVVAPRGSLVMFHGATWHGAFPRTIPGMRIMVSNYYRHFSVAPQEEIKTSFDRRLAADCVNSALFAALAGFDDENPYVAQRLPIPRAKQVATMAS